MPAADPSGSLTRDVLCLHSPASAQSSPAVPGPVADQDGVGPGGGPATDGATVAWVRFASNPDVPTGTARLDTATALTGAPRPASDGCSDQARTAEAPASRDV